MRIVFIFAFLVPSVALAQATELRIVPAPDGFVAGRETAVVVLAVDATGATVASETLPAVMMSGGKAGAVTSIAPGIWRVSITPASAGAIAIEASAGALKGRAQASARPERDAVVKLTLADALLRPDQRGAVTATIDVTDAAGVPLDGVTPEVDVTGGTVTSPQKVAAGKWTAKVTPPQKKQPFAMLVVATLPGRDALPSAAVLSAQGRTTIPITTESKAKVRVRVGKKKWDYVADIRGQVEAKIDAGPGDLSMAVESTDLAGNTRVRTAPLEWPAYDRTWSKAIAGPTWIDGQTRVTVFAVALDKTGKLKTTGSVSAVAAGTALALEAKGDVFVAEPRVSIPPGRHEVTVALEGDTERSALTVTPAPAVAVEIVANPDHVQAAGAATKVEAKLVDAAGKPVTHGSVAFSVEGLALGGMRSEPGRATATVTLVKGTKPTDVWLSAKAPGPGFSIYMRRPLSILAGPAARAEILSIAPPNLIADGSSGAEVKVKITDAEGYAVTKLTPTLAASAGEVLAMKELGEGEYLFTLRAPPSSGAGNATLTVQSGSARAESSVRFMRPPTRTHVAAGLSGESNLGALTNLGGWVEARRVVGGSDAPFSLTLRFAGRQGSMTAKPAGATTSYDLTLTQLSGALGARWRFGSPMSRWSFYATGAALAGNVTVTQTPSAQSDDRMFVGARAALQAERSAGAGAWLVELGYEQASVLGNSGSNELVKGPITGVALSVGYRHGF